MQRGTFRVHGCGRCKRRKVKCDNKTPRCSQCERLKKTCPGSGAGSIFVNTGTWIPEVQACGPIVSYNHRQDTISRLAIEVGSLHVSPWTPRHWLRVLPQLQLPAEFQEAILYPLRAMSFAYKSLKADNAGIRLNAFDDYARGLAQQRRQLGLLGLNSPQASKEVVLCALLMALSLLEFELMAPSSLYSWLGHAHGSVHLLAMLSPETCQASPFFELFWQLRFTMCYVALLTGNLCFLGQKAWLERPFHMRGKTYIDTLIDSGLTGYYRLNQGDMENSHDLRNHTPLITPEIKPVSPPNSILKDQPGGPTTAFERMMQILSTVQRLYAPTGPDPSLDDVKEASGLILSDAEDLLSQSSTSLRMGLQCVFMIRLVSLFTPCEAQKLRAQTVFKYWHSRVTLRQSYNE